MNPNHKKASGIRIWSVKISDYYDSMMLLQTYLRADELERAGNFKFERLTHHFIITRGLLRLILGCEFNVHPADVQIGYGPYGKPFAMKATGCFHFFNVSHTSDHAVFVVCDHHEVGVDIEQPDQTILSAQRMFVSEKEQAAFDALSHQQQIVQTGRLWVCKEALVKAIGCGLRTDLTRINVHFDANGVSHFDGDGIDSPDTWMPQLISPAVSRLSPAVLCAVVTNSKGKTPVKHQLMPSLPSHKSAVPPAPVTSSGGLS